MSLDLLHILQTNAFIQKDKRYVFTVSGGGDSVVLLHLCYILGLKGVVAHCNFHLRDEDSMEDERFVRDLAKLYHYPFILQDFETTAYARDHGLSIEMAARDLRYEWFETLRQDQSCDYILVAHHANDLIETFFLNLSRGTGLNGLKGMSAVNGFILRPLLAVSRQDIERYAHDNDLSYCTDVTNGDTNFKRNRIRHDILPLFEKLNANFLETMLDNIKHFSESQLLYEERIKELSSVSYEEGGLIAIPYASFLNHPSCSTILFEVLQPFDFNGTQVEEILRLLHSKDRTLSGKQWLSSSHRLVVDRAHLQLEALSGQNELDTKDELQTFDLSLLEVGQPKEFLFQGKPYQIELIPRTPEFKFCSDRYTFLGDAEKIQAISSCLTLRTWEQGAVFCPFGMRGKQKKMSDFFIDQKLSRLEKESVRILYASDVPVWIFNYRSDQRSAIDQKTTLILKISPQCARS